ncbi:MAG: DUF4340 domain-containing protein, partial [Verrucomicrobiota bacterium]
MNRAVTIFLFLLAAGLVVFVATTERWRFSLERTIQPGSALFDFDPADIRFIQIKNGDQSFRIQPGDDGWVLDAATRDTASPEAVSAIFRAALETPVLDRIDASEIRTDENLAAYGVRKSSLQLDFKGDRPLALLFGKTGADGNRTYVSFENSKTVYLIPDNLGRLISSPPDTFRDKRLAVFDPERVRRIEIHRGLSTLELENKGRGWRIVKPLDTAADDAAVRALLDTWSKARLAAFEIPASAPQAVSQPAEAGTEIRIFSEGSDTPQVVSFGDPLPDGLVAAKIQPRNLTVAVPAELEKSTVLDLDQLRDRSLARLNPDLVDLIRWHDGGTKTEIRRHEGRWSGAVEKFFKILAATKSSRYAPATPAELATASLTPPPSRLEFLSVLSENTPEALAGEHPVLSLAIGAPQADGTIPVHIEGTPEIA